MHAHAIVKSPNSDAELVETFAPELMENGYLIIPNLADPEVFGGLLGDLESHFERTPFCQGGFFGERTKRFGRLLLRSPQMPWFVRQELVLGIVQAILGQWCESLQLNLTQAIEIFPGARVQAPHRDQEMFDDGATQRQFMINAMWALDDFTETNGATRLWPGSHRRTGELLPDHEAISAVMPRGSVLLYLGSTQHSGGENLSGRSRRGMVVSYCLGWLKPWENQWLAYPPSVARHFDPDIAALVGYSQHKPSLGNFEGQCPSILLKDELPAHLPFVDSLRPDQVERLEAYLDAYYQTQKAA